MCPTNVFRLLPGFAWSLIMIIAMVNLPLGINTASPNLSVLHQLSISYTNSGSKSINQLGIHGSILNHQTTSLQPYIPTTTY